MSQDVLTRREGTSQLDRAADASTDPDNRRFDLLPVEPLGHDLLKHPVVSAVMRSRWYPGVFQIPIAAVFAWSPTSCWPGPPRHMRTPARP